MKRTLVMLAVAALLLGALQSFASRGIPSKGKNEKRLALVIGNSAYEDGPLRNPVNDANDIAAVLQELGFDVIKRTNAGRREMVTAMRDFGKQLRYADIGLFYYAGHGMQIEGTNYLIPVDARAETSAEVEFEAVKANRLLAQMEEAGSKLNIVILDACRNNPFRGFRSTSQGLAEMRAPKGSIIAYATAPGSVADDGKGRNGVFTKHLLRNIKRPGFKVQDVFVETGLSVMNETGDKQIPWTSSTPVRGFYLAGSGAVVHQPPPAEPEKAAEAKLTVKANVPGAEIEINGRNYGQVPQTFTIKESGSYNVRISKGSDYDTWSKRVDLVLGDHQTVTAYLEKKAAQPVIIPSDSTTALSERAGDTWRDPSTGMEFVWVPGGCYQMGCGSWASACGDVEKPVHEVCVDGFWIGKYEVTQGQWRQVMGNNPSSFSRCGDDCPVEKVSWNDVQDFIRKLSSQSSGGYRFRLPSEAEWEYAARSGGKPEKYSGGDNVDAVAWYSKNSGDKTHRVGTKQPNGLGIYDMSGNVWEWCQDVCAKNAYSKHSRNNPIYEVGGSDRVSRGGSWRLEPRYAQSALRSNSSPGYRGISTGFRLLRTP